MYLYVSGVIALQVTVWVVPSLIENAVAVAFIGLLLGNSTFFGNETYLLNGPTGPMYPILISHIAQVLPRWLLTGAVSWVAGIGTTGSAALPFLTGVLSEKFGIRSLQPL
jgi:fucose permease